MNIASPTSRAAAAPGQGGVWTAPTSAYIPTVIATTSSVPDARSRGPMGLAGTRVQSSAPTPENEAMPTT